MLKFLKTSFFIIASFFEMLACGQDFHSIDTLITFKVKEMGIKRIVVTELPNSVPIHEILEFDENGNRITWIMPTSGQVQKFTYTYDSLDRKINSLHYSETDTSIIRSETRWIYSDNWNYTIIEIDGSNNVSSETKYELTTTKDTVLISEIKIITKNKRIEKNISRHIYYGDTLSTSEYISFFSNSEIISEISTYYSRIVDSLGYKTEYSGSLLLITEEDYYDTLFRIDTKLTYEYDELYEIRKYDEQGRLIFSGVNSEHTKYSYNTKGQLVEQIFWGYDFEDVSQGVQILRKDIYYYDENGLLSKIVSTDHNDEIRTTTYEYEFY